MNIKFEEEIKLSIIEVGKMRKKFIIPEILILVLNLALFYFERYNVLALFLLIFLFFMILIGNLLKKRFTWMLNSYQTNPNDVIKGLENFVGAANSNNRNKVTKHAYNAYQALKHPE